MTSHLAAAFAFISLAVTLSVMAAEPTDSLISNGTFERNSTNPGWPDGWGSQTPENGKSWESENGHHFMRLKAQGKLQMLYRPVKLPAEKPEGLAFSIRYRTPGLTKGGVLILFKDQAGRLLGHESLELSSDAGEWTEATRQFLLPRDTAQLVVLAGFPQDGTGSLDIASLSATPLDPSAAKTLIPPPPKEYEFLPINGDFATATAAGDWPDGWGKPEPGMSWDRSGGFLRIVSQQPGQSLMLDKKIPLKPGLKGLELAIRFRTTGILHGQNEWFDARTIVHFLGADGKPLANEGRGLDTIFTHKPEPTDWIERTRPLVVPEGAVALELRPGLFLTKAGTVDLAKIAVSAVSDQDAALLQLADTANGIFQSEEHAEAERKTAARLDTLLASTGNLVVNGSFQSKSQDATSPNDWAKAPPAGGSWQKDKDQLFIRLTSQDETKTLMFYKMVPLTLGLKNVDVTFRYRTFHVAKGAQSPGDARAVVHFLDGSRIGHLENGKTLDPNSEPILFAPDAAEWTEITKRYLVPEGATKLQLMPGLWNTKTGTLDLAGIKVIPSSQ